MEKPTLYDSLILALRTLDEQLGGGLLQALLERPQYHFDETETRIRSLENTDSPGACPDALVKYLLPHVGFTADLAEITDRLSVATLRKLVDTAVPFWRQKGTGQGVVSLGIQFTGRTPMYQDWFDYRFVVGETQIGLDQIGTDPWIITSETPPRSPFVSTIRIMDNGTIDEILLLDLIGLMRPTNEYIEAVLMDFLDTFSGSLDRWTRRTGTLSYIEGGVFNIVPGSFYEPNIEIVPVTELQDYTIVHKFLLGVTGNDHLVCWYRLSGSSLLSIQITDTSPQIIIRRWATGIPTTIYSGDAIGGITIVPGAFYKLRIETINDPAPYLKVYIDDVLQYESPSGGESTSLRYGTIYIGNSAGSTENNQIDNMEVWRRPLRWAIHGPDGITTSSSFCG